MRHLRTGTQRKDKDMTVGSNAVKPSQTATPYPGLSGTYNRHDSP